jgi:zinc and cadmium transporter
MEFLFVLVALVLGSVGSVALAGILLTLKNEKLEKASTYLMYLAGGTLIGAAFLGMIPNAITLAPPMIIFESIIVGILLFFILEKIVLWRNCSDKNCERRMQAAVPIILIGDAFHNAMDGIVIAASFLTSTHLGVFVTLSVMLHEIPQELGDFGILIKSGLSRKKALYYNILSGSTAILTGIGAFFTLNLMKSLIPYALAFSAASFLYIALADLIPEMHQVTSIRESIKQIVLILSGILIIYLIILLK